MGQRHYEQKDHLGNVVAVITDRKVGVDVIKFNLSVGGTHSYLAYSNEWIPGGGLRVPASGTDGTYDYYLADVVAYNDYYSFGMRMPNRYNTPADGIYRYGFQGQEQDNEIKGDANSLNYEYRMHDPRLGRFLSIDPLAAKYPKWSPYAFSGNQVIHTRELEGLEPEDDATAANEGIEYDAPVKSGPNKGKVYRWASLPNDNGNYSWNPVIVNPGNIWEGFVFTPQTNPSEPLDYSAFRPQFEHNTKPYEPSWFGNFMQNGPFGESGSKIDAALTGHWLNGREFESYHDGANVGETRTWKEGLAVIGMIVTLGQAYELYLAGKLTYGALSLSVADFGFGLDDVVHYSDNFGGFKYYWQLLKGGRVLTNVTHGIPQYLIPNGKFDPEFFESLNQIINVINAGITVSDLENTRDAIYGR